MGTIQHHAIVATTWNTDEVNRVKRWISDLSAEWRDLFLVTPCEAVNGYWTIVMAPDGSKEGWEHSYDGDMLRGRFLKELQASDYSDGSSPWDIVEVTFGELGARMTATNCLDGSVLEDQEQ